MANAYTCRETAPDALSGNLGPLKCSRAVTRNGTHVGEHKAHKTVRGVGRITITWKQAHHVGRPSVYDRPEIELPKASATHLAGTLDKTRCVCPPWKVGIGHISPCPLTGLV
jgi:hypothetical protein